MLIVGKQKSPAVLVYLHLTKSSGLFIYKTEARLHEPLQEIFHVADITVRALNSYFRIVIVFHDVTGIGLPLRAEEVGQDGRGQDSTFIHNQVAFRRIHYFTLQVVLVSGTTIFNASKSYNALEIAQMPKVSPTSLYSSSTVMAWSALLKISRTHSLCQFNIFITSLVFPLRSDSIIHLVRPEVKLNVC